MRHRWIALGVRLQRAVAWGERNEDEVFHALTEAAHVWAEHVGNALALMR